MKIQWQVSTIRNPHRFAVGPAIQAVCRSSLGHFGGELEEENSKLKRIVADLSLDKAMLQDVLSKKL